jgi:hypothetical protein
MLFPPGIEDARSDENRFFVRYSTRASERVLAVPCRIKQLRRCSLFSQFSYDEKKRRTEIEGDARTSSSQLPCPSPLEPVRHTLEDHSPHRNYHNISPTSGRVSDPLCSRQPLSRGSPRASASLSTSSGRFSSRSGTREATGSRRARRSNLDLDRSR